MNFRRNERLRPVKISVMDTTAAAELAVGMPGPGVDGVGFWVGNADQDAWSDDEFEQTIDAGTSRGSDRADWGKGSGRRFQARHGRSPSVGTEHPYKRAKSMNGDGSYSGGRPGSGDYAGGSVYNSNYGPAFGDYENSAGFQASRAMNGHGAGMGGGLQTQGSMRGSNSFSGETGSVLESSNPGGGGSVAVSSSAPKGKGTGSIFFKTKLCCKFRAGTCPYNSNCNFAHGIEELRKPPPGWEEIVAAQEAERALRGNREGQAPLVVEPAGSGGSGDAQRFHKTPRPCRKYYTEDGCPYGDRCIFLHDDQGFQTRSLRESNAISLGPTTSMANGGGIEGNSGSERPSNWKTRICNKWETTGHCPFGQKCHFAHGTSDGHTLVAASLQFQRQWSKSLPKWKGPADEISNIYGDWIQEDEWENPPSLVRQATGLQALHVKEDFPESGTDDKVEEGQRTYPQNHQKHVPFFRGKKGYQKDEAQSMPIDGGFNTNGSASVIEEDGWEGDL